MLLCRGARLWTSSRSTSRSRKPSIAPVERLIALGKRKDRSVNYLVVEAILQYVEREEGKI